MDYIKRPYIKQSTNKRKRKTSEIVFICSKGPKIKSLLLAKLISLSAPFVTDMFRV